MMTIQKMSMNMGKTHRCLCQKLSWGMPAGFGHSRCGTIDNHRVIVTCPPGKIKHGPVAATHVEDSRAFIRRKVLPNQVLEVRCPEIQPVYLLYTLAFRPGRQIMLIQPLAIRFHLDQPLQSSQLLLSR
jgi:hypothetical protein